MKDFLKQIDSNIKKYGYNITFVNGGQNPPFAYTIGLVEKFGFELVIAGGFITIEVNEKIFSRIVSGLNSGLLTNSVFEPEDGKEDSLVLLEMHSTWKESMILGAFDYYKNDNIRAFQILPKENRSIDTPIMSYPWDNEDPIWCWLKKEWNQQIPISSYVITNVGFLKGETITEMMRYEEGFWEMFAGQGTDVPDEDVRILPISTVLALDKSLIPALELSTGDGLWRENKQSEWHVWE